jgi:hypothetical protein
MISSAFYGAHDRNTKVGAGLEKAMTSGVRRSGKKSRADKRRHRGEQMARLGFPNAAVQPWIESQKRLCRSAQINHAIEQCGDIHASVETDAFLTRSCDIGPPYEHPLNYCAMPAERIRVSR